MGRKLYLLESMKLKKGDTFEFGVWKEQPIEWQVLATRGSILCISKYSIEKRRFDEESDVWKNSELRQWLNSDFYNKAFNSEEKSFLQPYEGDKVTLLSEEEAKKYLPSKSKRIANFKDGSREWWLQWWWLRSRVSYDLCAATVHIDGSIYNGYVNDDSGCVRPVILLRKDVENYLEPEA